MGSYHFASGRHVLSRAWQLPTFAPAGMWSTTSMRVRERHWPEVTRALWGEHFWSPSYCVVSAGGAPLAIVKRYIETQQSPNRQGRPSRSGRPRPRPHGRGLWSPSVQYTTRHLAVVAAALHLVAGLRIVPRQGAMIKVFGMTAGYTVAVGIVDWVAGANYMFLRHPPHTWSLLSILGPWPWYLLTASAVALAFFLLLDAPFWAGRHGRSRSTLREGRQPLSEMDSHGGEDNS